MYRLDLNQNYDNAQEASGLDHLATIILTLTISFLTFTLCAYMYTTVGKTHYCLTAETLQC